MEEYSKITIPVEEYKKLIETSVRVKLATDQILNTSYIGTTERDLYFILTGEKLPEKEVSNAVLP